jgi:hypothetical protein
MLQTITQNRLFSLHRLSTYNFKLGSEYLVIFSKILVRYDGIMKINSVAACYTLH